MIIVFVRHGHRSGRGDAARLTPQGREQAAAVGAWLAERGVRPTHVVHTHRIRTRETADVVLEALGVAPAAVPAEVRRSLPRKPAAWDDFTSGLARALPADAVVLLVGHHPTDGFLREHWSLPAPTGRGKKRLAAVLEPSPGGWRCTDHRFLVDD